jgi:antigen flippase
VAQRERGVVSDVRGVEPARDRGLRGALMWSSGGAAAARFGGALGGVLAARLLGPTGRGQLAVLVFVATAGSMAAAAGVQFWVVREVARDGGLRRVQRVVGRHAMVIAVGVAVLGLALLRVLESLASVGPAPALMTLVVTVAAAINLVVLALPNGMRAMGVVAGATICASAVYVATTAGLLGAGTRSITLVLAGTAGGSVVSILVALVWARRAPAGVGVASRDWATYRRALAFGAPGGAGELTLLAMLRVDVLIVAAFLPLRDVGLYAVATALSEVLWIVPDGVAQVVLPTSARHADGRRTLRLLRVAFLCTAAGALAVSVVAPTLITVVFGTAYSGAARAVPLLAVAAVAGGIWKIVAAEIVALGRTTPRLTSAVAGLGVMVGVDLVAVPLLGITGAALGSACGYAVAAGVVTCAWARVAGTSAGSMVRSLSGGGLARRRVPALSATGIREDTR